MNASIRLILSSASLAMLISGATHAYLSDFTGQDENGNEVDSQIDFDPDPGVVAPNDHYLGVGCVEPLYLRYKSAPVILHGQTYGSTLSGHGPFWAHYADCTMPDSTEYDPDTGNLVITYLWGATSSGYPTGTWNSPGCDYIDGNHGAHSYTGTYSGANNPRWDCAKLIFELDPYFYLPISVTLIVRELRAITPTPVVWQTTYHLTPTP